MKKENKTNEIIDVKELLVARFGKTKVGEWEKQFAPRKINVIEVEDKIVVLRPVGSAEVANFSMMAANPDIGLDKASSYLINELWVDGDDEIRNDEEYFISAMLQVQSVIELKKSSFYRL